MAHKTKKAHITPAPLVPFPLFPPAFLLTFLTERFSMCSCRVPVGKGWLLLSSLTGAHEKSAPRISMAEAIPEGLPAREKQHHGEKDREWQGPDITNAISFVPKWKRQGKGTARILWTNPGMRHSQGGTVRVT